MQAGGLFPCLRRVGDDFREGILSKVGRGEKGSNKNSVKSGDNLRNGCTLSKKLGQNFVVVEIAIIVINYWYIYKYCT